MGETRDDNGAVDPAGRTSGSALLGSCYGGSVRVVHATPLDPIVEDPLARGDSIGDPPGDRMGADPVVDGPPGSNVMSVAPGRSTLGALLSPTGANM